MINPKIIKDLGIQYTSDSKKYKKRFALVECPLCNSPYKTGMGDLKSGKSTKCKDCMYLSMTKDIKIKDNPLFNIFSNMKQRCNNKNHPKYNTYGGRGIKVMWDDVSHFIEDMYSDYQNYVKNNNDRPSIDRIDNDGNYEKSNCRWISVSLNSSRRHKGVPKSENHKQAMSKERKGKPQTKARKEALDKLHTRSVMKTAEALLADEDMIKHLDNGRG